MVKPKGEEEEKPDGLEIISIGSLYNGPWDKKYWSSSRGKERYPYPVGYHALRVYNGSSYEMEIHEGPKGPSFLITSADGQSCSGQTPDIAWDKFQKKGCPNLRIWHGRRFSCKIDGIEFFGFKNPLVQRLLRELVANVNGVAEQSLLSSSFCNGISITQHVRSPDASTQPDLLPSLAKPRVKRKRSKRHETTNPLPLSITGHKRRQPEHSTYVAKASSLTQGDHNSLISLPSAFSFNEEHNSCRLLVLPTKMHLKPVNVEENCHLSAKDCLPSKLVDCSAQPREKAVANNEKSKLTDSENHKFPSLVRRLSAEENPLDELQDSKMEKLKFLLVEDQAEEASTPKDSQGVQDVDLCAPDTLDLVQDDVTNFSPSAQHNTCNVKEELVANDMINSEGLVTESHPEEETGALNLDVNSEKSDPDSVGQEIAKSMMTLLLPQAIPLLQKTSIKKNKSISTLKKLPFVTRPCEESNRIKDLMAAQSSSLDDSDVPTFEHFKSVVLDSFDDCQDEAPTINQLILPSNNAEADQTAFKENTNLPNGKEPFVKVDAKELSEGLIETCGIKDIFYQNEVKLVVSKSLQDGDLHLSESVSGCMPASKKVFSEKNHDACKRSDENSLSAKTDSEGKNFNNIPYGNEVVAPGTSVPLSRMDMITGTGATEIDQVPKRVYTRKKVNNATCKIRKYNPPLSESIVYRNDEDGSVPEIKGTLPGSETSSMTSSLDKQHKQESFDTEPRVGGPLHCLHQENTTNYSNPVADSIVPFISQTLPDVCSYEDKDTSNLCVSSIATVKKPQCHFENKMAVDQNILDVNHHDSFLEQRIGFSYNSTAACKELKSHIGPRPHKDLELSKELEGIIELVGCYFHSDPVLSILLSTIGNEIYVSSLCGSLANKERTLFLYKLAIDEQRMGCPTFVGYSSLTLPSSTNIFGKEIALERSGLQLTPDGQGLVLLDSIKTPYCREGRIDCSCSTCTSDHFDQGAAKIVEIKAGYVSVIVKLRTIDSLQCLLVCEPNHLIAAGETGRLHVWTLNSTWSASTEEFFIAANDYISPCIAELKKIPKCSSLIVGCNEFGEFTLWDIQKRIFLSRFSAQGSSVYQFFPIRLFSWQREVYGSSNSNNEKHISRIMDATKMWFSEQSENDSFPQLEGEDAAIWLIVSTLADFDSQHDNIPSDYQINPAGCWRLALLVKKRMVLGSVLDPRAAALGASAGYGIIGTLDGQVYMWELLTGTKLGALHNFKDGSITSIATDDSSSGIFALAGDKGQLLVYRHLR